MVRVKRETSSIEFMQMKNPFLLAAGCASFLIAVLHVFIIIGGAEWYRFFGAGEQMATLAEQGSLEPVFITLFVTLVFTVWGLYAFSGAGMIRALPLRKSILIVIASILTLRGLAIVSPLFGYTGPTLPSPPAGSHPLPPTLLTRDHESAPPADNL